MERKGRERKRLGDYLGIMYLTDAEDDELRSKIKVAAAGRTADW